VGDLEVYFDPAVSMEETIVFSKYVDEDLLQRARHVERLRHSGGQSRGGDKPAQRLAARPATDRSRMWRGSRETMLNVARQLGRLSPEPLLNSLA
jgi:hypothetical protein